MVLTELFWSVNTVLSGYFHWDQLAHAQNWLLFEKNIGAYVCIDEVALSRGELYTIIINKAAHGGKGSIIAIIRGTDTRTVSSVLLRLSRRRRYQVREITLDMAPNMEQIARNCFLPPNGLQTVSTYRNWLMKPFRRCV